MGSEIPDSYHQAVKDFHEKGLGVVDGFFTEDEVSALKSEMFNVVEGMNPEEHATTVFTTDDDKQHAQDDYFLTSSDKIRFFYEEGVMNKKNGQLLVDKQKAFNKVGHALHWLNPVFKKISFSDKVQNIVRLMNYKEPKIVQSMYIFKQPKIGGVVTGHMDSTFLYVNPIEHLMGCWVPVDDATLENGCLHYIPGSHKIDTVERRFLRTHDTSGKGPLLHFNGPPSERDESKFVAVPVKKGSLVLIHGLVWHKSEANTSEKSRHAYTWHVVDTKDTEWSPDNWLQQTDEYKFPSLYTSKEKE